MITLGSRTTNYADNEKQRLTKVQTTVNKRFIEFRG